MCNSYVINSQFIKVLLISLCLVFVRVSAAGDEADPLQLLSNSFQNGDDIPNLYTCVGENLSPLLSWVNVPPETKSYALVMLDPEGAGEGKNKKEKIHWLIWNIPEVVRGVSVAESGYPQGLNGFGKIGYSGPCPASGRHHYFFILYALNLPHLSLMRGASFDAFTKGVEGHVLQKVALVGAYQKPLREGGDIIQAKFN